MTPNPEILSDGRTVWVNDASGMCIARFGRFGIDIHRSYEEQATSGKQCLDCTHGKTTPEDWQRFVESVRDHYGVEIADQHRPGFLTEKSRGL